MSDERLQQQNQQRRHNCCRLCLAPDNECISILNSYAADKEPLASKIHSCVSIKISSTDNLSLRICHACISYLNSWQSFKNRCLSAQNKQRSWLDGSSSPQKTKSNAEQQSQHTTTAISDNHSEDQQQKDEQSLASSILEGISTLKKRKSLTVYPLPAVQIKDEPMDAEDDYNNAKHNDESDEMVDPTMFLERTADEGEEPIMDSSSAYDYDNIRPPVDIAPLPAGTVIRMSTKEAACRACNLKFSTRANARRHEKNLHPHLFDTLEENDTTLNKQTAALNASLELQRAVAAAVAADACKLTSSGVITQQKYRHEVVTAFNNSCEVGYDYDNPEKYQHLLTDEKIVFLQQNDEFIRQYHAMTCRCCNRFYTTYKNFMAHMRKKYLTLPRNCCFNCLKLNDSKALFISHLKKRNCINLHRVLHSLMSKNANFAAAVSATVAAAPEKLRAKELLVNKMYECRLCPKTFRLKLEFRTHVYDEHADAQRKDINTTQCSFCGIDIEDPAERKRHYNNMDCIVTLRCVTCDTKHETQQKFMEHVQDKHMTNFGESTPFGLGNADNSPGKSSNVGGVGGASSTDESRNSFNVNLVNTSQPRAQYFSRMPQACPICGQQYNNYNNVLRHMESKHPDQLPQTYKCVKCGQGYPRLSNLREHMVSAHGADKARHTGFEYIVNADAVKAATDGGSSTGGNSHSQYTGRYDYVMKDLMSITNGGTLADDDGEFENSSKKMRFDGPGSNGGTPTNASPRECPICNAVFANNIGLSNHMRSHQSAANNSFSSNSKSLGGGNSLMHTTLSSGGTQAILKKSLEQAADRRFRRMRCRICQRRFSSKKSYRYHMLNDHQIRNVQFIKCKLCDAEFAYEKGLKVHMFKIHNTLLKDDMIIKQYECEICSIVYRTDVELQHHLANVHKKQGGAERTMSNDGDDYNMDESVGGTGGGGGADATAADLSGISTPVSVSGGAGGGGGDGSSGPLYWYQCKYCPSNFNTNKKLAIHINSHDEFDSNDYSCKDCGNVYSGRKSLWVHRYKKHPQIPEPSECVLCKKVFFDSQMLDHHIPTCNRKPITSANNEAGGAGTQSSAAAIYKHKTGDDDEDDDDHSRDAHDTDAISTNLQATAGSMKIKLPEVACTICGARFTDQELFVKHIQMHEQELYTDNPLAAMFDTGPADPNQFYMDRVNDNGEYACDLCSKTFTQMTAFKVHRKWHFRGDNKQNDADHLSANQVHNNNNNSLPHSKSQQQNQLKSNSHPHLLGLQAVGLVPRHSINSSAPHALNRSQKRKRELKCQYCPSTFISNNNLRRHLFELHKNEIGNLPEPPRIECDPPNMCRKCNVKFESKAEWIEHKVGEARVMKPFGPFQWGCDLCGAYVSRKEKLINHLHNHMKEQVIVPVEYNESGQQKPQQHNNDNSEEQQNKESAQEIHEFKKIKLPGLQQKPMAQMEDDSRDSAKDQYENDEDGDGDSEQQHEANNNTRQNQQHQGYGDDDDDDEEEEEEELEEEILEGEFDDLAVGAQQTVGGEEDEEVDLGEDEEDDDDEDDDEEDDDDDDEDDDDVDDEEVDEDDHAALRQKSAPPPAAQLSSQQPKPQSRPNANYSEVDEDDDDDDDEDDDDNDSDEFDDDDDASSTENRKPNNVVANAVVKSRFSCDLCQVYFDTQLELQKHVKMHFLNGPGSVTLTGIKTSKSSSSSNKSRSSSSDVLAVSSS